MMICNSRFSSVKVVVFDCDGVLFDSREANIHFYNHILKKFNAGFVKPEQVDYVHTHSVRESIYYLIEDTAKANEAFEYAKTVDFSSFFPYMALHNSVVSCLKNLRDKGYRIAVATNRTASTREVLQHFKIEGFFDLVVCASDVEHPKPHPDMLKKIMLYFGVSPHNVLYVGDSGVDEECARRAGVYFMAFRNSHLKADAHVEGFDDLCRLLDNYHQIHPIRFEECR